MLGNQASMASLKKKKCGASRWCQSTTVFRLMKNTKFLLYCLSYFFVCAGLSSVYMHLIAFSAHTGVGQYESNYLVTIMGITGIIGRATSGFTLYYFKIRTINMYIAYMATAGIATVCLPTYCINFTGFSFLRERLEFLQTRI